MLFTASDSNPRSMGQQLNQFFNQLLAFFVKLFIGLMALVFALSLIVAGFFYLVFASIRFLLTGQKPAVAVVFSQLRQYRQSAADGVWPAPPRNASSARPPAPDVVDVEVREIDTEPVRTEDRRQP